MRCLSLALLLALSAPLSAQTTWFVDASGTPPGAGTASDPYTSIRFALAQAATIDGDELRVASGTYPGSIDFLGKAVVVQHDGAGNRPLIEGDGITSAVRFVSGEGPGSVLRGFEVTGTVPAFPMEGGGGVLVVGASPVLENVTIRDCSAAFGGGVAVLSGALTMNDCDVLRCTAENGGGGGIHVATGSLTIVGGSIVENEADGGEDGGGIEALVGTDIALSDLLVERNLVNFGFGGGVYAEGQASLDNVEFRINGGAGSAGFLLNCLGGGGICATNAIGTNCRFEFNGSFVALRGGAAKGGSWTDTVFFNNTANGEGGGLHGGSATNCVFRENSVLGEGDVPSGPGGGAYGSQLTDCLLENNQSEGFGGGAADSDLLRCTVRGNTCTFLDFAAGGGIFGGTAVDCLIEENRAWTTFSGVGGGAASADLVRCVVRANVGRLGGGVRGGTADRCTIVHNWASGDIGQFGGGALDATVVNSILWGNLPDQVGGSAVTFSNVQGGTPGQGNLALNPAFYGPGSDVYLLPGSPSIDAGDPNSPRDPDGSRADQGAIPFDPGHLREDGTFCIGDSAPALAGSPSFSGPPAVVQSFATLFLVSPNAGLIPRPFAGSFQPSALCLKRGITRILPSAPGQLELTPSLLNSLGLAPGDRLLLQTYTPAFGGPRFSRGLDVLVLP